jgi:hypothetical protein
MKSNTHKWKASNTCKTSIIQLTRRLQHPCILV